jgi:two-component system, OmpR family, sensor histidine kinase CreC
MRISLKLLAGYFLIVGLAAYFVMRIFVAEIKPSVRVTIEENMVEMANMLAELATPELIKINLQVKKSPNPKPSDIKLSESQSSESKFSESSFAIAVTQFTQREVNAKIWNHQKVELNLRVYVTNDKGIVLYDSSGKDLGKDYSAWRDVYLTLRGQYGARSTREIYGDDKSAIYHVAAPIKNGKDIIGVVTVAKPISSVSPIIDQAEQNILSKGLWLVLGSLAIGLWVSYRLQRSVGRLVGFAESLAKGEQAPRPASSTKELQQLAASIEKLRGQLDGKRYVEGYVQALTHELKSPLTALQAHAELLADGNEDSGGATKATKHSAGRVLEQTFRIRALVDQMLVLTRLESGHVPPLVPLDWLKLLEKLFTEYFELARLRDIRLQFERPNFPVLVLGDETLLSLACSNLLQNALDFSPGASTVRCWLETDEKQLIFLVKDEGVGLSVLAKIKLFERYFSTPRLSTGARSSGLGLSLSKEIIHAHHGSISIEQVDPGVLAKVSLPRHK